MGTFFLGTHKPCWLKRTDVPLFLSARRLRECVSLPRALGPWALDSGGFSELSLFGGWKTSAKQYALEAKRWQVEIGNLAFAAPQDWMCEPFMLAKTGLSLSAHQLKTVHSYLELSSLAPEIPWIPVLQGYALDDYLICYELYERAGVSLASLPLVGVGSVCRRQGTGDAVEILETLSSLGLSLHGFGFKMQGLKRAGEFLASSDSMAWSLHARKRPALPECSHANCANCLRYALAWRERMLS